MEMDELKNNKMFWALIAVTVCNIGAFFIGKVVVDKAADRVIQKLQKEYSPGNSPYGPTLDPDKLNPDALKATKNYFELRKQRPSTVFFDESLRAGWEPRHGAAQEADTWREQWEKSRGVNPE
jgi:hypothetical protein